MATKVLGQRKVPRHHIVGETATIAFKSENDGYQTGAAEQ